MRVSDGFRNSTAVTANVDTRKRKRMDGESLHPRGMMHMGSAELWMESNARIPRDQEGIQSRAHVANSEEICGVDNTVKRLLREWTTLPSDAIDGQASFCSYYQLKEVHSTAL